MQTDKGLTSQEFGPWMLVTRRTPKQCLEARSKPVRTVGLTTWHAEHILHQTESGMIILPTPLVGPTEPLHHSDQVNQSPSKPHDPDSHHHALLQNRFSHLADLSDDGLNSTREESTSLTQITSLASTSANTEEHVDVPHPHGCTVTCT